MPRGHSCGRWVGILLQRNLLEKACFSRAERGKAGAKRKYVGEKLGNRGTFCEEMSHFVGKEVFL